MFAQTCRGRRLDDPKKQTNLMFFRPVVCYECDFAPLRRLTAPPLPQGEALSEFIPQRRQEMNPRPTIERTMFVQTSLIVGTGVLDCPKK